MTQAPGWFVISVPPDDPALVEFIARGIRLPRPAESPGAASVEDVLLALAQPLRSALTQALASSAAYDEKGPFETVSVHCVRATLDREGGYVGLVCAYDELCAAALPGQLRSKALELLYADAAMVARHGAEHMVDEMDSRASGAAVKPYLTGADPRAAAPIGPDAAPLLPLLGPGIVVELGRSGWTEEIARGIARIGFRIDLPPRDGLYDAVLGTADPTRPSALVSWKPYQGRTPYPEIRAALELRLPTAFAQPRWCAVAPPGANSGRGGTCEPQGFDSQDGAWMNTLCDIAFSPGERADGAARAREALRGFGLDAIGWYQPYHDYSEKAWGIYVDARRLDDLACSISELLESSEYGSADDRLAAVFALTLVYQHQLFHAKVEAVLSWSELQALRPKYRRYAQRVQAAVAGSDDALEEALANDRASTRADLEIAAGLKLGRYSEAGARAIRDVIDAHLDFAPPGHSRWREATNTEIWKLLATQMIQARTTAARGRMALPLDGLLREPLPFDFVESLDLPLRFVDSGRIMSALSNTKQRSGVARANF